MRTAARVALGSPVGLRAHGSPAGATWTNRTLSAPWEARSGHTSVVDASSGAIYVIGGGNETNGYQDAWASTDGGARAGLASGGYWLGTQGVL